MVNEYYYFLYFQKVRVGRAGRTTNRLGVALSSYWLTGQEGPMSSCANYIREIVFTLSVLHGVDVLMHV